jgi:hypothetical protein
MRGLRAWNAPHIWIVGALMNFPNDLLPKASNAQGTPLHLSNRQKMNPTRRFLTRPDSYHKYQLPRLTKLLAGRLIVIYAGVGIIT